MKLKNPILVRAAGFLGAALIRGWMSTLDYRAQYRDPTVDPVHPSYRGQKIYVFWHEYILFPIFLRGHCNLTMLLSRHGDAEILSRAALHLGFDCVRGSSNRGGAAALRTLVEKSRSMNLTITPDGPRGPRRVLAQGPIYLASRLHLPLVAMGFGYDGPWRLRSWDRFAIPRPFSKARAVVSQEILIPPDLDRDGIEQHRLAVEGLLNELTEDAETWAASGCRRETEKSVAPGHLHRAARRQVQGPQRQAPRKHEIRVDDDRMRRVA